MLSAHVQPEVHYARSGDVSIAYQVVGEGPVDLVLVHGWICTFHPGWEDARIARFYRRLASMGRLILFDKRGTGLSDRVSPDRLPDLETRMDDVRAVMDAVGSDRAAVLGISEGGPLCALFAATYPERTVALVLMGTMARDMWAPDYPLGYTEEQWQASVAEDEHLEWGVPTAKRWLERTAPEAAGDPVRLRWYGSYVVRGASPGADFALSLMNKEIDVRGDLRAHVSIGTPAARTYCRSSAYIAPASCEDSVSVQIGPTPALRLPAVPPLQGLPQSLIERLRDRQSSLLSGAPR